MEKLIERFVSTNTRCYTCGGLVYAVEKKTTTNHIYHNRCFRCRICKRNLTGSSLNEEGDDIYCANCYRKKQRGDCDSLDFRRAANERATYVHNGRHPDQPSPKINPRPPIQHNLSRHPSWTLRQLERRFLSHQEPNTKDFKKLNDNYRQLISVSHPLTIKTSFSVPINLTNFRRNSSITIDESSPSLQFFPILSPSPNNDTGSIPKIFEKFDREKINKGRARSTNGIGSRLNQSSVDLTFNRTPSIERKQSTMTDVNQKNENKNKKPSKFYFPDKYVVPIYRRTNSVNYSINPRKIK